MTLQTEILRHLHWLGADKATIADRPGAIGLEIQTRPGVWERVWGIAIRGGHTLWVATYKTTYQSVSIGDLRFGDSPAFPPATLNLPEEVQS